jgi:MoaA/NifB/PqqE/SkfB family radical SAM enzyme
MLKKVLQAIKPASLGPPGSFFIELTNHCNLRCSMCNFHSCQIPDGRKRPRGFMDVRLARSIVRQVGSLGTSAWVALHGAGEPLLHRGLIEIVQYASSFDSINCGFLTNGMLLDEFVSRVLLDSGLSWIGFSIDGMDKEKFEKYRVGATFDRIINNVLNFLRLSKKKGRGIKTKVNMTVQEEMEADVDSFIDFWIDKVDEVLISPYRPVGRRDNALVDRDVRRVPCYMLTDMMVLYWNGKIGLCCEDWFNDGNMGDASSTDLVKIWNGRRFRQARKLHENGLFHRIPLCTDCNSWHVPAGEDFFDEKKGCSVRKTAWQHIYRKH